jgi:predicted nucleic acid-binding protein
MLAYVDTSMLVKRYLPELGSDEFEARLLAEQPDLLVSELVQPELTSALRRRVRQGHIDADYLESFQQDLRRSAIRLSRLDSACLQRASALLRKLHAPLATLDALHLATALEHACDMLFTSDLQLARAASEAGLSCWPSAEGA